MKLKTVEFKELKGINRNAVEGVAQTQPTILQGFELDRGGGYRARFGEKVLTISGTFAGTIVANDDRGYVSLGSISGTSATLSLYDGTSTVYTQSGTVVSPVSAVSDYYHLEGVGAVANLELAGLVTHRTIILNTKSGAVLDGNDFEPSAPAITLFTGTTSSSGLLDSSGSYRVWLFRSVNTARGQFWIPNGQTDTETLSSSENALTLSWDFNTSSSVETDTDLLVYLQETTSASSPIDVPATLVAVSADASTSITINSTLGTQVNGPPAIIQFDGKAVFHRQRFYGRPADLGTDATALYTAASFGTTSNEPDASIATKSALSIVYSALGTVNAWQPDQYFIVPFGISSNVTGIASSPAGLLIFGDSETFLMRGDPGTPDSFSIQVASGVIGMDNGTDPVRLGGTVFTIYKGEIYAFALGMGDVDFGQGIQKVSNAIYDPVTPFTEIASEPETRHLVALDSNGSVYRFEAEKGEWLTDVHAPADNVTNIFSNPDSDGVRFYFSSNSTLGSSFGSVSSPRVRFEDVDLGDKNRLKAWRRVYLQTNADSATLFYTIAGQAATISGEQLQSDVFVFTFPSGLVANKADILNFTLTSASSQSIVEPNITIEYVERYKRRG